MSQSPSNQSPPPLTCSLFLFEWLSTLFSTVFPPNASSNHDFTGVFDFILREGEPGMISLAIALSILIDGDASNVQRPIEVVIVRIK